MAECERCEELRGLAPARGPDGLAARIRWMLGRADDGSFRVEAAEYGSSWSELDRSSITGARVRDSGMERDCPGPSCAIRCGKCGRTFTQSWVPDRGYERWRVESG